jgi:hypothetical protein
VAWLERGGGALVGEAWGGLGRGGVARRRGWSVAVAMRA